MRHDEDETGSGTAGIGRFELRAAVGWGGLLLGAVPFLVLWLLVESAPAVAEFDGTVADALNSAVSDRPTVVAVLSAVTDLGGTGTAVLVMVLATVFLLIREHRRLAAFVATAGLGLAVLGPATKAIVDRARPLVDAPVVETPSNASFPSGHSMTAMVVWGALLLVALPAVRRRTRPWLIAAAALVIVAVGLTRLALGVHFVSDVLAGWALGAGWLAVATATFRAWQHDHDRAPHEPMDPLEVPPGEAAHLVADGSSGLPSGTAARRLLAVAAALFVALSGLGLLVTAVLGGSWLTSFDRSVVQWAAEHRSPTLNTVLQAVSALSDTRTVIALGLTMAVLGLAVARSRRPVVFVLVTLVGEVALYFAVSEVVTRARPAVADLTSGLPTAASWPSGHVAAAAALYGAAVALLRVYGRPLSRWIVVAVPAVVTLAVAVSRVYVAAHYPTDVLAGAVLGAVWVWACAWTLLPDRRAEALDHVTSTALGAGRT